MGEAIDREIGGTLDRMCHAIEVDIVFGVYAGGTRLVEDALMVRFAVKRHQVRDALVQLEGKRLVERIPNRGAVVVELMPDVVDEIYQVREVLECAAARITPLPAPPSALSELAALQRDHARAVADGEFRRVFELNIAFHRAQFALCGNGQLIEAIEDFSRRVHTIRAVKYGDHDHMRAIVGQHLAMVDALGGKDIDAYVAAVRVHLPASPEEYRIHYHRKHGSPPREVVSKGAEDPRSATEAPAGLAR